MIKDDDELFQQNYSRMIRGFQIDDEEKTNLINKISKNSVGKFKLPRISAAAIILLVCISFFGGITVFAISSDPIREFLFGKDSVGFEKIYKPVEREYVFGKHKLILHGVVADQKTGVSYLSVEGEALYGDKASDTIIIESYTGLLRHEQTDIYRRIPVVSYSIGEDVLYIIFTNCDGWQCRKDGDYSYFKCYMSAETAYSEKKKFGFLILDEIGFENLVGDLHKLTQELLNNSNKIESYGNPEYIETTDRTLLQDGIQDKLEEYGLKNVEASDMAIAEIFEDNFTAILGRTDIFLEYDSNYYIYDLVVKREDGTEILIIHDNKIVKNGQAGLFSVDSTKGKKYYQYEYGLVLGENEKVSVVLNGTEYN